MLYTFKGGIHIKEYKLTAAEPVQRLPAPARVRIPLSQHIGAPCTPTVSVGDTVDKGQMIGDVAQGLGCPVHATVSGRVSAIEEVFTPAGRKMRRIVIENDGEDRLCPDIAPLGRPVCDITPQECVEAVRLAGVSGMGGATFPTYAKISSALGKVDKLIINCAECEPFITADHRLMLEEPRSVINGAELLASVFGTEGAMIAIENNKLDAAQALRDALGENGNIHIKIMKTKYPQGGEKQLINAITGRKVGPGQLPWQVGAIVSNADTCRSIYRAVRSGMPLLTRIVTTGGDCVKSPGNFRVRIGTPLGYIIEQTGGLIDEPGKVVMGGPMMGLAVPNLDVPTVKGTSGLLVFNKKSARGFEEGPCLRCAKCVYVCPMNLLPNKLDSAARADDWDTLNKLNITDCIECGSCAYVCPAKRRQVQQIKVAKVKMREAQQKAK